MNEAARKWISNSEICRAIFHGQGRRPPAATCAQWQLLANRIPGQHTKLGEAEGKAANFHIGVRLFSREAIVMIGMTGRLPFNVAFRSWIAQATVLQNRIDFPDDLAREKANEVAELVYSSLKGTIDG